MRVNFDYYSENNYSRVVKGWHFLLCWFSYFCDPDNAETLKARQHIIKRQKREI